jgi:hypothetical protein
VILGAAAIETEAAIPSWTTTLKRESGVRRQNGYLAAVFIPTSASCLLTPLMQLHDSIAAISTRRRDRESRMVRPVAQCCAARLSPAVSHPPGASRASLCASTGSIVLSVAGGDPLQLACAGDDDSVALSSKFAADPGGLRSGLQRDAPRGPAKCFSIDLSWLRKLPPSTSSPSEWRCSDG